MQLQRGKSCHIKQKLKISNIEEKVDLKVSAIDPTLILPGDKVIEDQLKEKALSPLKKVEGVINYFVEIKKDKEKSSLSQYLSDITIDKLYLKKCQNTNKMCFIRLPIIVINEEFCSKFKEFLFDYYQYKKYQDNIVLLDSLILGSNDIENYEPFHEDKSGILAAECINTDLIKHYNNDQIYSMNNELKEYFEYKGIKGIGIDFYYDDWINDVMKIFFNFIVFNYDYYLEFVKCDKCKKTALFMNSLYKAFPYSEPSFYNQIYEDMEDNQTYGKSVDIANNIVDNVDFSNILIGEEEKQKKDTSLVNIIYYDEGINNHRNEIIGDSFLFEKECNGTLLLVTSIRSMLLLLKSIKNSRDSPTFHLICSGSAFENLMKYLLQFNDFNKYIIGVIIYTYNVEKYYYLQNKYNILKGIYSNQEEIIDYIRKNKSDKNIKYKIPKLVTYKDYNEKYIEFHKIISLQYGKLYQKSSYLTALNILEEYLIANNKLDYFDLNTFLQYLEVFSQGPRDYKKIINIYTHESFYALFNKWLVQIDPLAIRKIAFFISGLQLSLNIYGIRDKKGFNCLSELYRGALFNYPLVLDYERNIGNIITYPSFFSTTLDVEVAKKFSRYNEPNERKGLFSANYIIRLIPGNDWISQGFNISNISNYKGEKEILFQPFCFFKLTNVTVDLKNNICFIYLELIGKKEIWEKKMNKYSSIVYQKPENYIELKYY